MVEEETVRSLCVQCVITPVQYVGQTVEQVFIRVPLCVESTTTTIVRESNHDFTVPSCGVIHSSYRKIPVLPPPTVEKSKVSADHPRRSRYIIRIYLQQNYHCVRSPSFSSVGGTLLIEWTLITLRTLL